MPEIQSKLIYHGLPVFAKDVENLTAIVTGANGISGNHQLKVLCETPRRWKKIYALSRRPPHGSWPDHVEHISIDLLQSSEDVAAELAKRGVRADYVFFFAYIQPTPKGGEGIWSAEDELVTVNSK
jgi:nucleoside-diphosphate-sugar epimerase